VEASVATGSVFDDEESIGNGSPIAVGPFEDESSFSNNLNGKTVLLEQDWLRPVSRTVLRVFMVLW
jgi:hypothetical protein